MKRIALCGCGRVGRLHAGDLAGRADLLFVDRSRAAAEALQKRYGGEVADEYDDVLRGDADAVLLATPPQMHCSQTLAALAAGKSVLVEKPLCTSPDELEQIDAAAGGGRPFVMVAENYYYKPVVEALRAVVESGRIGEVRELHVQKLTQQGGDGWRTQWGALLEGGIHFVSLAAELADMSLGESAPVVPDGVAAEFPGSRPEAPERHARLRMTYASGLEAGLHYSWDTPSLLRGVGQHSRLRGDKGSLIFESNGLYMLIRGGGGRRFSMPGLRDLMGYGAMTDDFLSCLDDPSRAPYSNLARARRDLGIIFAAYAQREPQP